MKQVSTIILIIAIGGLLTLGLLRLGTLMGRVPSVVAQVSKQQELSRPASLQAVVVADGGCAVCTSTQPFLDALQKQRVELSVRQIDGTTDEGKRFIAQQRLERFPAVIVAGETSHSPELEQFLSQITAREDGTFVYSVPAPYHEVAGDKVRGLFRATYITSSTCSTCYDVTRNAGALQNLGVNIVEDKIVAADSAEGKDLIKEFNIRYVPAIILVGDLEVYPAFQEVWPQVGSKEQGGTYVLRDGVKLMGTYYDLKTKQTVEPEPAT